MPAAAASAKPRLTAREMRLAAALRSARSRSRRTAMRRSEGRDIEVAFGKAVAEVLPRRGIVTAAGRVAGRACLDAHPDLAAVVSGATQSLAERFAAPEVVEVLQARLAQEAKP